MVCSLLVFGDQMGWVVCVCLLVEVRRELYLWPAISPSITLCGQVLSMTQER